MIVVCCMDFINIFTVFFIVVLCETEYCDGSSLYSNLVVCVRLN